MRIGFDVSQTGTLKAGCGYYAEGLIRHLAEIDTVNEYILYPTFGDVYWDPDGPKGTCQIDRPNFRRAQGHASPEESRAFWRNGSRSQELELGDPDIVHANNFFCPTHLKKARLVYTFHDFTYLEYPELTTEQNRTGCFQGTFNASLYADFIIAISEYSRRHFLEIFPHYPAERTAVIYPASRFSLQPGLTKPEGLTPLLPGRSPGTSRPSGHPPPDQLVPGQFWLNVGTLDPRKNHLRLLQAFARLKREMGRVFPLVLAGASGSYADDLKKTIQNENIEEDVFLLGYVKDLTLQWLYQNCFALVYPSLFEGFGMPVIEAMSLGAPVITSSVSSLPEIAGPTAWFADPTDEQDWFQKMLAFASAGGIREKLKRLSIEHAKKFSWHQSAHLLLNRYQEILSRPPHQGGKDTNRIPSPPPDRRKISYSYPDRRKISYAYPDSREISYFYKEDFQKKPGAASEFPMGTEDAIRKLIQSKRWYQVMELAPGIFTPGRYDPKPLLDKMGFPRDLSGKTVLDIGSNDGFHSFESERRGAARVLAIDRFPPEDFGFSIARKLLGSKVEHRVLSVYELSPDTVGEFDVVLFLGVIYHLRHPLLALEKIHSICRETLFLETHVLDDKFLHSGTQSRLAELHPLLLQSPILQFYPQDELESDASNWFAPNVICVEEMLRSSGFSPRLAGRWGHRAVFIAKRQEFTPPDWYGSFQGRDPAKPS